MLLLLSLATAANAQTVLLNSAEPGRIRGVVFDSLRMVPMKQATVMLMDGPQADTTDQYGRFELTDVLPGRHAIAFASAALDSLGLGTLGVPITMVAGATANVNLATPSFRTLWLHRCGNAPALTTDSGIVWGTVRDAATNMPVAGASAQFAWYDLNSAIEKGINIRQVRKEVTADESGLFVACGLPTDLRIVSSAIGATSASGEVEYQVGELRLQRLDLFMSTDMVVADSVQLVTRADSMAAKRPRGAAVVAGIALDYRKKPLANATVNIANVDTLVRTNKSGQFVLGGLPSGTQQLEARKVSYAAHFELVHLHADSVARTTFQMSDFKTLTTINVRANSARGSDRLDYERRRKTGFGYFFEPATMARSVDLGSILTLAPRVTVHRTPNGELEVMMPGKMTLLCQPRVFLDGLLTTWEIVNMRVPKFYRAIEVYPDGLKVPPEFTVADKYGDAKYCGTVMFWSFNARW